MDWKYPTHQLTMSTSTDPRTAIMEILADIDAWDGPAPEINYHEDVSQKAKRNQSDPALYLLKSGTDDIDRFSADDDTLTEDETVEIQIWVLEDSPKYPPKVLARRYRDTIIDAVSDYLNDNYANTEFHSIEPSGSNDYRHQHLARKTDHYIYSVDISTHRLI